MDCEEEISMDAGDCCIRKESTWIDQTEEAFNFKACASEEWRLAVCRRILYKAQFLEGLG